MKILRMLRLSVLIGALVVSLQVAPVAVHAQTPRTLVTYMGAWSSSTTYNTNEIVTAGGLTYISKIPNNLNNAPASTPSDWDMLGGGGGGGGFTAGGDLSGSGSSQQVNGIHSVALCTGFTPTNGQVLQYTTGGSPNPCYTAATPASGAPTGSASGDLGGTYPNPSVVKVNGASLPLSAVVIGTDAGGHVVSASAGISASLNTGAGFQVGGDSICADTGASDPGRTGWPEILRPQIGGFFNKNCRPSDLVIDSEGAYYNTYLAPTQDGYYPITMLEAGINDAVVGSYGANTDLQADFRYFYAHEVYDAGIAFANKSYPAVSATGWTFSGSWSNDATQGSLEPDYVATSGNANYSADCGSSSCVYVLDYAVWSGLTGHFNVVVDSGSPMTVPYGSGTTFYSGGVNGANFTAVTSATGTDHGKHAVRIPMSSGTHTIHVNIISSSDKVGINWIAKVPIVSKTNPNFVGVSIQHRIEDTGSSSGGVGGTNDTLTGTYNGFVTAIMAQAATDGINAYNPQVRAAMISTNVPIDLYVASPGTSYSAPLWQSGGLNTISYDRDGTNLTLVGSSPAQGQYTFSAGTYGLNVADATVPMVAHYAVNCGTETSSMANCTADGFLHPNDIGHAIWASVIKSSLPSYLITGNNVPQVGYPLRNYLRAKQFPSQMMSPNGTNGPANGGFTGPGFIPGINFGCYVSQCSFMTMTTAGGLTTVVPNFGGGITWSIATTSGAGQATSESQLVPAIALTGNGVLNFYTLLNNFNGTVHADSSGSDSHHFVTATYGSANVYSQSTQPFSISGWGAYASGGSGVRVFFGVGNHLDNVCSRPDDMFFADLTSGCSVKLYFDHASSGWVSPFPFSAPSLALTNCASSASPAVCGASTSGSVTVAAAATTETVNTTAITASSQIQLTFDSSLGTRLGVTCNTTAAQPTVSAKSAGSSFTITLPAAPATNPACFSYTIIN